jgi:hypothetical protein
VKQRQINKHKNHANRRNDHPGKQRSFNANCAIRRLIGFEEYIKKVASMENTEDMISAEEAVKFLDIEISTFYFKFQDAHERDPLCVIREKIYFSRKELAQWVA